MKRSSTFRNTAAIALLTLALPFVATAPSSAATATDIPNEGITRPSERTDGDIQAGVRKVLNSRLRTNVFDWVEAEINGPNVTLRGAVYFPATLDRIERQIRKVPGVMEVAREVEILPVSAFDDRLRRQAYYLIYGNVAFSQYPALGRLPIHILVQNGRVTLVGSVASKVQARLAETRVRAATLALDVDNRIEVRNSRKRASAASTFI